MPLSDRLIRENAAYSVLETLKGENAACLLSDRSRALAKAIVLKRHDDILFLENHGKGTKIFFFNIKIPSCLC